jgi:hypothetical protein
MNYFTKIPDELILEVFLYQDYSNLVKMLLVDKLFSLQYSINYTYIYRKLIKNYGYKIVEDNSSFNLDKPNFRLSISKNSNIDRNKFLEGYLSTR